MWHRTLGLKRILFPVFNGKDCRQTQMSSGLLRLLQFGLHVNCEGLWRATCSLTECCWTHLLPSRQLITVKIWKLLDRSFIIIINTRLTSYETILQKCLSHSQVTALWFCINALKCHNMKQINKEPKLHKINPVFLRRECSNLRQNQSISIQGSCRCANCSFLLGLQSDFFFSL